MATEVKPALPISKPTGFKASAVMRSAVAAASEDAELATGWTTVRKVGAGLQNLGNTCFMNSVLQCLMHTPPLAELLLSARCPRAATGTVGPDVIAFTRDLMQRSLQQRSSVLAPLAHAKSLRRVNKSFRPGRQEDAHEYLLGLLDAMHESTLAKKGGAATGSVRAAGAPPAASFVTRIFGGRVRSQVKCQSCGYESNTYEPFLELSLDIGRSTSVTRALQRFTAGETLQGSNAYRCPREGAPVRAVKSMRVEDAPRVLALTLKRFEFGGYGQKIGKKIDFDAALDLAPFLAARAATPVMYDLYAVLVHSGHSVHSGHYYAFVKAANGLWNLCDDASVSPAAGGKRGAEEAGKATQEAAHEAAPPSKVARTAADPAPEALCAAAAAVARSVGLAPSASLKKLAVAAPGAPGTPDLSDGPASGFAARGAEADTARADAQKLPGPAADGAPAPKPSAASTPAIAPRATQKLMAKLARGCQAPAPLGRKQRKAAVRARLLLLAMRTQLKRQKDRGAAHSGAVAAGVARGAAEGAAVEKAAAKAERSLPAAKGLTSPVAKPTTAPAAKPATAPAPATVTSTDPDLVRSFLLTNKKVRQAPTWDGVDADATRAHDRLLRQTVPSRRAPDEYNDEYDRGRVKKVRAPREAELDAAVSASAFDAAARSTEPRKIQLRGRKRKAAEQGKPAWR
ncbi:hypothetical protein QBZ16_004965 [Prototheca wickerhamii]|uniref:Ubiquitin carboxyl-terminal hydrolase n=1 Tax=Prototheca wickerhamii TaxID=3111 RepID=A0AAD9IFA2_PROWI|nr:hypothetical protein QBZ16_004965 [Prototheca wickerhamii]